MQKTNNQLKCIAILLAAIVLSACGGGGSGSSAVSPVGTTLSADQAIYEQLELHGGASTLVFNLPYGGGNLVSGTNYIYSSSTGGLSNSPLAGPQTETPVINSLDTNLALPPLPPTRYLQNGQVLVRSQTAVRKISYVGSQVHIDYLADDSQIVVASSNFYNFSEVNLSGIMGNAAEELQAAYPITDWINAHNFSANAQWQSGAAYTKRQGSYANDIYIAEDCTDSLPFKATTTAATTPCQTNATLNSFFPVTLLSDNVEHPTETDFATDGTISTIQGVRMWVANSPLPMIDGSSLSYRIYYELNGNVYMGVLLKASSPFLYLQNDGSFVNYTIGFNQTAVNSIQQGLITGASVAGSQAGSSAEVSTVDLFGIGGHGVDGALAPVDLLAHYGIPANLNGAGQTIAIVDLPGLGDVADDLNVFSQHYNLPQCNTANPCFQKIDLSNGTATPLSDWGSEIALDTQMVHAIAPAAKIILVTANSGSNADLISAINYAAGLPGVTIVSMSFTLTGTIAQYQSEDIILAGLQSNQGITFFAGSGDDGYSNGEPNYPATSPYVTGVGGTRINSIVPTSTGQSEVAWQFSGGGASSFETMPSWQTSYLTSTMVSANRNMRAVPDVSAVADFQHSAFAIYHEQVWTLSGGTSAAAPLWAGVGALFGQYLANEGKSLPALVKSTPGGFNGLLYQSKLTQGTAPGFYDIVSGSNNLTLSACAVCTAITGYDDVTGLGTPSVTNLFANY